MPTLIDLKGGCLKKIWKYLSVQDLVNIAEASGITDQTIKKWERNTTDYARKRFQFARSIQKMFRKKYGTGVQIDCVDSKHTVEWNIKLLQHFGGIIVNLYVIYDNDDDRMAMLVDDAILSFCRESLCFLHLVNVDEDTMSTIWQPFPKVHNLILINGYLSTNLSQFNKWFPMMKLLKMNGMQFDKSECIEQHFSHLDVLNLSNETFVANECNEYNSRITDSNLKIAIQLNPQLTALKLADDEGGRDNFGIRVNKQFLFFMKKKLSNLHSLALDLNYLDEQLNYGLGFINFDNLKSMDILVRRPAFLSEIPILSQHLKCLTVAIWEDWNTSTMLNFQHIAKFIKNNPSDELNIEDHFSNYDLYSDNMIGLVNQLPKLKAISIVYDCQGTTAIDAIIYFLSSCKQIQKFTAYNPIDGSSIEPSTFVKLFKSYAEINAFDSSVWRLKFGWIKNKTQRNQQFISFCKRNKK